MHKLAIILLLLATACNNEQKSKESTNTKPPPRAYNRPLDSVLSAYYRLSESFVKWDSAAIVPQTNEMVYRMDMIDLESLKHDPETYKQANFLMFQMVDAGLGLSGKGDITSKRKRFDQFSQSLFDLLKTLKYNAGKIYLQECTMPYDDTGRGVWISKTEERRNPYLGLYHPYYKAGMLECGTLEETIDNTEKTN